jgi:NADH-quinone oxidoreductase subunit A
LHGAAGLRQLMSEYIPVLVTFALAAVIVGVMVSINSFLGPRSHSRVKGESFECGNEPTGPAWVRFSIRFYIVAILFIIFDIEVVFLYPWAVIFRELGLFGFIEMLMFVGVLGVGFVYSWRKGAFEWS